MPKTYIHDPWNMPPALQQSLNVVLGEQYPMPIQCAKYTDPNSDKQKYGDYMAKVAEHGTNLNGGQHNRYKNGKGGGGQRKQYQPKKQS
mmetsp:Transcript_8912/g.15113  ORF Transcript_8912/g.15113 Transcript_8912/m.15113 type:complete len:89 (+) Transcript_8912:1428-1694(+)